MIYCFDSRIAVIHGVAEAVIYEFLMKNVLHNKLHNVREQDGNYWTPLSFTAMNVLMPFFSVRQISTAVGNLVDEGLVLRKKIKHKSIWFSIPNEELEKALIIQKCTNESLEVQEVPTKSTEPPVPKPEVNEETYKDIISIDNKSNSIDINLSKQESKSIDIYNPPIVPPVGKRDISKLVAEFAEHREALGKNHKMTEFAKNKLFNKLSRWSQEGWDVEALVDHAIESGWKAPYQIDQYDPQKPQKGRQQPQYIRGGINPDLIEQRAYEELKRGKQNGGNADRNETSTSPPNPINRITN